MKGIPAQLVGQRFGRLMVIRLLGSTGTQRLWECRCDCGAAHQAITRHLRSGSVLSCGCSRRQDLEERFWSKVDKGGECWTWKAGKNKGGYGIFALEHRESGRAHRVAWELTHGPIPNGLSVLHRCDNPPCVRPDHLFLGTDADNMHDRHQKGRYAAGAESWSATHRDRLARGEKNYLQQHPRRGDEHPQARLTAQQAGEIRRLLEEGKLLHREIAARFGVHRSTVTAIRRGRNWNDRERPRIEVLIRALGPQQGALEL